MNILHLHHSLPRTSSQGALTNDCSTNCFFKDSPCTTDKLVTRNTEMQHWYKQKKEWPFDWASSSGYLSSNPDFHEKVSGKSIVHGMWREDPLCTLLCVLFFNKKNCFEKNTESQWQVPRWKWPTVNGTMSWLAFAPLSREAEIFVHSHPGLLGQTNSSTPISLLEHSLNGCFALTFQQNPV